MFNRRRWIPRNPENISWAKTILVPGEGPMPAKIMGIGQGPGFSEATSVPPTPFQPSAPAGGELNMYLDQIGLHRESIYLTNAFKYFVADQFGSDRPPTQTELQSQWDILEGEINLCQPKVIVCLGAVALKWMMRKAHLHYHTSDCHRGYPVGYYKGAVIFAASHPAAGVHSPDAMKLLVADFDNLKTVLRQVDRGDIVTLPQDEYEGATDYRRISTEAELDAVWCDDIPFLSLDTEGTRKHPIMLQMSWIEGTGYAIYASDQHLVEAFRRRVLRYARTPGNKILMHNALYDIGVLAAMGIELPDGSWIDTMVMAFLLGTEPLGLKPLGYRLRGMKMQSYEEQIGPKSEEMALNYLLEASLHEWPTVQELLIRDGAEFRMYKPQAINVRINKILRDWAEQETKIEHVTPVEMDDVNKKGEVKRKKHSHEYYVKRTGKCPEGCHEIRVERDEPVDLRDRWQKKGERIEDAELGFETTGALLRAPVEKILGPMPSATLEDIPESQALAYANRDSDATTRIGPLLLSRVTELGLEHALQIDMGVQPILHAMMAYGMPAEKSHFIQFGKECRQRMDQVEYEVYKLVGHSINLSSGPQLSALLFGELHLPSNRWTKSRDQLAVDKKALEPLRYMHPVVPLVLEFSELQTLYSNYAETLPNKLDADGRVHCKIGLTRVPSGRLNASDPNLMAQPTRSELGQQIRNGFIAPRGYQFVCTDLNRIELKIEADESQDKVLVDAFLAGIDGHTDTAQRVFKVDKPTDLQRAVGKTINFLIVNRGGGQALMEQLMLQKLAASDWCAGARYIEGAVIQSIQGECHRFRALTEGIAGQREPEWDRAEGGVTQDGNILFQEIGPSWTKDICDHFIAEWYREHPGVAEWHEKLFAEARRFGYVRAWSGRLRYSPEIRSSIKRIQEQGTKKVVNFPIQAGAQDAMKVGMCLAWEEMQTGRLRKMKVEPLLQIHDDLAALVEDAAVDDYCDVMEDVMSRRLLEAMEVDYGKKFTVPLGADCKVGPSWGSIKKRKR